MSKTRTEINTLGEFGLIEHLNQNNTLFHEHSLTRKAIGDDAAVLQKTEQESWLVSTDLFIEGIHFDLAYAPLKNIGYKAVTINLSDIAAMNTIPSQITVSIAVSNRFSVEALEELYEGIKTACKQYQIDLIGGDTTASQAGLIISITAMGVANNDKISYRNGAKANDIICVSGDLGGAYMGLQVLIREKEVWLANPQMQPQLTDFQYIVGRQLKPEPRTDIIKELAKNNIVPTSMIDISDGLASEMMHICQQSNVGALIVGDRIPIHEKTYETALSMQINPLTAALNGGEDYELLFTIAQKDYAALENHPNITPIGYITTPEKGIYLQTPQDTTVPIQAQGWNHFQK